MANLVIDKPSGTLHLVGTIRMLTASWTWLQGTVDPGTSTVYFDTTVTISGTHSLYNVYLSGGAHTVTGGDTLTALGTLTLDNGTHRRRHHRRGRADHASSPPSTAARACSPSPAAPAAPSPDRPPPPPATCPIVQINTSGGTLTLAGTIRTANDWTYLAGCGGPGRQHASSSPGRSRSTRGRWPSTTSWSTPAPPRWPTTSPSNGDLTVAAGTLAIGSHTVFAAGDVTVERRTDRRPPGRWT